MNDHEILKPLAARLREIAALPVKQQRAELWRRHNALEVVGPVLLVSPEGSWLEILPATTLRCAEPVARALERQLRMKIWQFENVDDDLPVEPVLNLTRRFDSGNYGVPIPQHHGDNRGSYVWEPPLQDIERDMAKLRHRQLQYDEPGTRADLARAQELVGDILPVRVRQSLWWTMGLTWEAIKLLGLEPFMLAMYDQPAALHRLMAWLRDDHLAFISECERLNLLTPNDGPCDGVGSGGLGHIRGLRAPATPANGPCQLGELWGLSESQETVGVSPEMFAEFILPYQVPLMAKFGLVCYGCCEPLDARIDRVIAQMPRLRRVSVAPMADLDVMAAKLGGRYIYSRKPNPAHVCVGFNEPAIRDDIRRTLRAARGQPLELILKDTHTVENDPSRLGRWAKIAREEIAAAR